MKLELPDNNASVLFHMGNALQSIAKDLGMDTHTRLSDELTKAIEEMKKSAPPILQPADADALRYGPENLILTVNGVEASDTIDDLAESIGIIRQQASDTTLEISDTIDADGLPWDQRIHSRGKTRLADNTWRTARKPNDKTDEEWAEYVEGVKAELRALMAIPVTVTYDPNEADPVVDDGISIEDITQAEINAGNLPPVVDAVVTPPVVDAVVTPPVVEHMATTPCGVTRAVKVLLDEHLERGLTSPPVVTPPVVNAVVTGPTTFPELMKFITMNNKKLTKESVDEALKAQGLASITLLAARTDLIPRVHSALVKLL